jgi:hypothetical protein
MGDNCNVSYFHKIKTALFRKADMFALINFQAFKLSLFIIYTTYLKKGQCLK